MKKVVLLLALCHIGIVQATDPSQTVLEKTAVCAACHGPQGISTNPLWPNLAGQHAPYLLKQLHDFKTAGKRDAPTMAPLVNTLSEKDMEDLAAFYATQAKPLGETPEKYLKRGQELYLGGDFSAHITACIACHGPTGSGNAQAGFPVISGQHAPYTIQQLQAFKNKKRNNSLNDIMHDISVKMNEEDMEAVAYYLQGLH